MKHGSLFSGIGGFDLPASWMGWENVFHCERNEFCQRVLKYYFPNAISYNDITKTDFTIHRGTIDCLTGGFPCQKYSIAGSQVGHEPLKEHFIRAIRGINPTICILENVGNFIGAKFAKEHDDLCKLLEAMDYETQTLDIDAASCGLSTMERHIWIVATTNSIRQKGGIKKTIQEKPTLQGQFSGSNTRELFRWQLPESRVCELGKGFPFQLSDITFSKWHGEAVQALGNAIPPIVALEIFKALNKTLV
jgi:DNA (cytosine-5)-methyltransferase 1